MANETTPVTWANALTTIVSNNIMPASTNRRVMYPHVNVADIQGLSGNVINFPLYTDLGTAGALTAGTAASNTSLALGTNISATVVESAGLSATIGFDAIELTAPGMGPMTVGAFSALSLEQQVAIVQPSVNRMAEACLEARENDLLALFTGLSDSVGDTTVDITVANFLSAQYELTLNDCPHDDWAAFLAPNQILELKTALGITSGGFGGSVWANQATAIMDRKQSGPYPGFQGVLLGDPVIEVSAGLVDTANSGADNVGGLICRGVGDPRDPGFQMGAFAIVERGGFRVNIDPYGQMRGLTLTVSLNYKAVELRDSNGVKIVTDVG